MKTDKHVIWSQTCFCEQRCHLHDDNNGSDPEGILNLQPTNQFSTTQQNDTSHWSEMTLLPSMIWSSPIAILVNSIFASFHLFIIYTFTFLYLYTFILLKSFWYFCQFRHCRYFTLFENISMYLKDNISASLWLVVDWLPSQMICGTF